MVSNKTFSKGISNFIGLTTLITIKSFRLWSFWDVTPCKADRYSTNTELNFGPEMEAPSSSRMLVNKLHDTTSQMTSLHTHCHENFTFHIFLS
jgi:hypothetical protein